MLTLLLTGSIRTSRLEEYGALYIFTRLSTSRRRPWNLDVNDIIVLLKSLTNKRSPTCRSSTNNRGLPSVSVSGPI